MKETHTVLYCVDKLQLNKSEHPNMNATIHTTSIHSQNSEQHSPLSDYSNQLTSYSSPSAILRGNMFVYSTPLPGSETTTKCSYLSTLLLVVQTSL